MPKEDKKSYTAKNLAQQRISEITRSSYSADTYQEEKEAQIEQQKREELRAKANHSAINHNYSNDIKTGSEKRQDNINKIKEKTKLTDNQLESLRKKQQTGGGIGANPKLDEKIAALEKKNLINKDKMAVLESKQSKTKFVDGKIAVTRKGKLTQATERHDRAVKSMNLTQQQISDYKTRSAELSNRISSNNNRLKELEGKTDEKSLKERAKIEKQNTKLQKEQNRANKNSSKSEKRLDKIKKQEKKLGIKQEKATTKYNNKLTQKGKRFVVNTTKKIGTGTKSVLNKTIGKTKIGQKGKNTINAVSNTAKKAAQIAKDTIKKIQGNALNKAMSAVKQAAKQVINNLMSSISQAISSAVSAIFGNPIVLAILGIILVLLIFVITNVSWAGIDYLKWAKDPGETTITTDELRKEYYKAWTNLYKEPYEPGDEEEFYNEFRAIVSSDKLAAIALTFQNESKVTKSISKETALSLASPDVTTEDFANAYRELLENAYSNLADRTTMRKLFLDYLDYDFKYLVREYTDWTTQTYPSKLDSKEQTIDDLNSSLLSEAESHDEMMKHTAKITYVQYRMVPKSKTVENTKDYCDALNLTKKGYSECLKGYHTETYEEEESYTTNETVEYYIYRDKVPGSEYWTSNIGSYKRIDSANKIGLEHYRATLNVEESEFLAEFAPGVPKKDAEWTKIYVQQKGNLSGLVVRRTKFWRLKKWDDDNDETHEDVMDLIIYEYNPSIDNYHFEKTYKYSTVTVDGDADSLTFNITSLIDSADNKTYTVDKKEIYSIYYDEDWKEYLGIDVDEKYWNDASTDKWRKKLKANYLILKGYVNGFDFQFSAGKFVLYPYATQASDEEEARQHITQYFNGSFSSSSGVVGDQHNALDIAWGKGTEVVAAMSGEVTSIRDTNQDYPDGSSGDITNMGNYNYIEVKSHVEDVDGIERTFIWRYLHIQQNCVSDLGISVGDTIEAGDTIAYEGHNGYSTAPHTHFQVQVLNEDGTLEYVDIEPYIQWTPDEE